MISVTQDHRPLTYPAPFLCFFPQVDKQAGMAKEENIVKKIDLKASVNCCDGCRRKVVKALSIKGVLNIDIHPTLPKVTVVGNVEPSILIKKLAKCGKTAELWEADPPKKQDQDERKSGGGGAANKVPDTSKEVGANQRQKGTGDSARTPCCGGETAPEKKTSSDEKSKAQGDDRRREDADKSSTDGAEQKMAGEPARGVAKTVISPDAPPIATGCSPTPQVNYFVNLCQAPDSSLPPYAAAGRVYYAVEPYHPAPSRYPAPDAFASLLPPPCLVRDRYYISPAADPKSQAPSLPSQFGDYFNDENTVGCSMM